MASPRAWQLSPAALSSRTRLPIRVSNLLLWLVASLALVAALALPGAAQAQARTMIYVDKDAVGPTHDGLSWATAYTTVQAALDVTNADGSTDYEIWVAEGTYYPDEGGSHVNNSRTESFTIRRDNVQLYGGFAGTETLRSQRNWTAHPTVLNGDIDGDGTLAGNAYSVVYLDGVTNESITAVTVLDGFTVSGGNADGGGFRMGGGFYCDGGVAGRECSPLLANMVISGNSAMNSGGGMCNDGSSRGKSSPTLINVTISGNYADSGGGIFNFSGIAGESSPTLINVTISGNYADYGGGGMYNYGGGGVSSPTLTNVTISGNHALVQGGGMVNDGLYGASSPLLTNVIISGNRANQGGAMYNDGSGGVSSPVVRNSILWGNTASSGTQIYDKSATPVVVYSDVQEGYTGTGNIDADPLFAAPVAASSAPTTDGDLRLLPGSPAIDSGTNADAPATDMRGLPRPVNGVVDMGAYEAQGFTLAIIGGDAQTATVGGAFTQPWPCR